MEACDKLGSGWRAKLTPMLHELGFEVLNPVEFEPEQLRGLQPNRLPDYCTNYLGARVKVNHWHDLKHATEKHLEDRFKRYMQRVKDYDLNLVRTGTDYIIALWDDVASKGAGTHTEINAAGEVGVPVNCMEKDPLPAWLVPDCTKRFRTWKSLEDFLKTQFKEDE